MKIKLYSKMQQTKFKQTEIGMIPEDWEVKNITQLGEVITGKTPKTENKDNFGQEYPFITPRDMKGQKHIFKTERYLSEKGKNSVKNCLIPKNSVCVSCIGSDMGKLIMTTKESITNQQINSIVPNTSADFIYYAVLNVSPNIKNLGKQSTALPILNKSQFSKIEVAMPLEIKEIENIAKILSSLDSKIELNQQMNKTLEAIGQAIFKHWFIDFEFPDEKGKPYKNSGGEMVDSELGEIPKGWRVGKVGDFIFLERGLSYKGSGLCENGIPMINLGNIAPNNHFRYEGLKYYSGEYKERNLVKPGDLVIANTDITQNREVLGSCLVVPSDLGSDKIIFTHHIYAVRHKNSKLSNHFLSYLLQIPEYRERATGFATGTTVLALPEDAILNFNFVLPSDDLMKQYNLLVTYIKSKTAENIKESKSLSQIRDSLLPKLMSGKIRVPVEVK